MEIKRTKTGYQIETLATQGLAPRESQTLLLLANGYSYQAAATELGCGVKTIAGRVQNLFYKLRADNGPQLIAKAFKTGHLFFAELTT